MSAFEHEQLSGYQHVGLQIQLPPVDSKKSADVFYYVDTSWLARSKRLGSNILNWAAAIPRASQALETHSLVEYEKRLVKEIQREKETGNNDLNNVDLDQYYAEHILKSKKS